MAIATAWGSDFLSMPCQKTPVLYIDLENPAYMVQNRLRPMVEDQQIPELRIRRERLNCHERSNAVSPSLRRLWCGRNPAAPPIQSRKQYRPRIIRYSRSLRSRIPALARQRQRNHYAQ